ncbi:putative membrane protein [Jatrophihabitans sp. GAS493]|uniref:phage holin family protein n=1 Tax=Jatrophihabitans sp. GAS493 TaxID=1907575 RepID=UPI000BB69471|nr:phage holin family protein [Jatrophihabitans sp. GAS493]SOD73947.1 putative membrane protein [Jatrophihabitans sp. GAS493]
MGFIRLVARLVVLGLIIGVVAKIVPGVEVHGGFFTLLWLAVLFSVVNAILGPIFFLFGLPLVLLTFGLFLLVINAGLLAITAGLSSHLDIDGFWDALFAGLLISIFSWLAEMLLPLREHSKQRGVGSASENSASF